MEKSELKSVGICPDCKSSNNEEISRMCNNVGWAILYKCLACSREFVGFEK